MRIGSSPLFCRVFLPQPLLQAFPLLIAGCVLPLLPPPAGLFIYSSRGKWVFPPLLCSFPPNTTFTSFPAPGCWACAAAPPFSSQLVRDFPSPPLWRSGCLTLFATCLFCYCLLFSFFSLFSLGGGWSVQGSMLIWPRVVCGSTAYHLAHLVVCVFPSHLGAGIWLHGSPPGFSV
jgi:hypothetical protein